MSNIVTLCVRVPGRLKTCQSVVMPVYTVAEVDGELEEISARWILLFYQRPRASSLLYCKNSYQLFAADFHSKSMREAPWDSKLEKGFHGFLRDIGVVSPDTRFRTQPVLVTLLQFRECAYV